MAPPRNAISLEIEIRPEVNVIRSALSQAAAQLRTFRKPLDAAVRNVLAPRLYQNFDTNGADGSWEPLAAATVKWKLTHGFARVAFEPLKRTGKLQKRAGQANLWKVTSDTAALTYLTGDAAYGIYHNEGYPNVRTGRMVPARPWAVILDEDVDKVQDMIEAYGWAQLGGI